MQSHWPRRLPPLALAATGAAFAVLAVVDKFFGLVQRPLHLATLAYASLFALVGWACWRGIQLKRTRLFRLSIYAAVLLLNVLTAAYVFAWRMSADPTPVLLQNQLARGDALLAEEDKDGAHLVYREAYRRFPVSFPVLMRMGAVNYQVSDFSKARKYFEAAVKVAEPDTRWRARNDLGQTLWKLGQPEEAIRLYEQAREEGMPESELVEWHYRMAWAHFDAKNYEEAAAHYLEVADAGEKYAAASYYNAACAQTQMLKKAVEPLQRRAISENAVDNLREAWMATTSEDEKQELRKGLVGAKDERDPELEALRSTPAFRQFTQEFRAQLALP